MKILLNKVFAAMVLGSIILLLNTFFSVAQIKIPNSSFESDTVGQNLAPKDWQICMSNPDILPFSLVDSIFKPKDGKTYTLLAWYWAVDRNPESIGTKISCIVKKNYHYHLSIYISTNPHYASTQSNFQTELRFFGGTNICSQLNLLGNIYPNYSDTTWHQYTLEFSPKYDFDFIKISCYASDTNNQTNAGALRIDNMSDIYIDEGYNNVKVNAFTNNNCTVLSCTFAEGVSTDYVVKWFTANGNIISNNFTIDVCPYQTTKYYIWAKDSCGYYSTDSVIVGGVNSIHYDVNGKLQFDYSINDKQQSPYIFVLYNILGQEEKIVSLDVAKNSETIDVKDFANAIYIAVLKNRNGEIIWKQKILILK
ncbi:MAG: hypothetical protein RL708_1863 [Bacteroidota bacterium]|jgi:hypothetical protein